MEEAPEKVKQKTICDNCISLGAVSHRSVFEPGGDWNQGMVSVGLPPASRFDAQVNWDIEGKTYGIKLEGVECAK